MTHLQPNDLFPDFELTNQEGKIHRLSRYTVPSELDRKLDFEDGYPLIVQFYRGYFCPRDQQYMKMLVSYQDELAVNYCRMVSIAVQPPVVQAAFQAGLGATWPFLADPDRKLVREVGILDETEGEYPDVARPFTFILRPDMTIHKLYDGWYFVGRPTLEELRQDLRDVMQSLSYYNYDAWNTDAVKRIRIPAKTWENNIPEPGESGYARETGIVSQFDLKTGNGIIHMDKGKEAIFFNFTAIPGHGYRTILPGTRVLFEIEENPTGRTARNIHAVNAVE